MSIIQESRFSRSLWTENWSTPDAHQIRVGVEGADVFITTSMVRVVAF